MTTTTPSTPATQAPAAPAAVEPRSPAGVWWRAYRHHLRLLRNTAIAWTAVLAGIGAGVVATFEERLPTAADRATAAAFEGVPAFEAMFGRYVQPATLEGFVLSRWGMFAIFVAVWGMLAATKLVGRPIFFSMVIITLAFVPVFALTGREGKLFHPLAFTKTFAMVGPTLLSVTLVPFRSSSGYVPVAQVANSPCASGESSSGHASSQSCSSTAARGRTSRAGRTRESSRE